MTTAICRYESFPRRHVGACPNCGDARRIAVVYRGVWTDPMCTCCHCGDRWSGGEMLTRPFRPRWRAQNMAAAEKNWAAAGKFTDADHKAWLDELLAYEVSA